jgi:hypothetical protein
MENAECGMKDIGLEFITPHSAFSISSVPAVAI